MHVAWTGLVQRIRYQSDIRFASDFASAALSGNLSAALIEASDNSTMAI